MKKKKPIQIDEQIVVTDKRLFDLDTLVNQFCDVAKYEVTLKDQTEIANLSYNELVESEKNIIEKINKLRICGYKGLTTVIDIGINNNHSISKIHRDREAEKACIDAIR